MSRLLWCGDNNGGDNYEGNIYRIQIEAPSQIEAHLSLEGNKKKNSTWHLHCVICNQYIPQKLLPDRNVRIFNVLDSLVHNLRFVLKRYPIARADWHLCRMSHNGMCIFSNEVGIAYHYGIKLYTLQIGTYTYNWYPLTIIDFISKLDPHMISGSGMDHSVLEKYWL